MREGTKASMVFGQDVKFIVVVTGWYIWFEDVEAVAVEEAYDLHMGFVRLLSQVLTTDGGLP